MWWSHKLSPKTERARGTHQPPTPFSSHTEKNGVLWSKMVMLVRAAPVHVQSRSFRKDGARGGTEAGGCACLWGRPVQAHLFQGWCSFGVWDMK